MKPGAVDALSELAAELKAKRDELDRSIVNFDRSAQQAASDEASARGKSADANRQQQEAERELARTQDTYAECVPSITDLGARVGLKAPPKSLGESAFEHLQALESACRGSRTTLMARVTAVREFRTRLDTALSARERAQQEFDQGQRDLHRQRTAAHDARIAAMTLAGETDLAHQQVAGIEDQVRPFLATAAFSPADLHTDRAAVLKTLGAAAAAVRVLRIREAGLATRLAELDSARDQKTALRAEAERQQDETRSLHSQRVVDFRVARDSRALLLGGEPTNDHRTRVNESRKASLKSLDEAQRGNYAAAARLVRAEAVAKQAADARASNRGEHAEATQAYSAACLAAHLALERAGELLDLPPSVAKELRDQLDALERSRHTAEAQREARQNDVNKLRSEEVEAEALDVATTALETLHSRGRKVGVITHVSAMIESIPVQVKVEALGGGSSVVRLVGAPGFAS